MYFLFWFYIILLLIFVWFLLANNFKLVGKFFYQLWKNVIDIINKKE